MAHQSLDISALSPADRLDLIEQLWDSIRPEDLSVTDAQRAELASRLAALSRGEMRTLSLEQVLMAIRSSRASRRS